jgi:hypothetical protein
MHGTERIRVGTRWVSRSRLPASFPSLPDSLPCNSWVKGSEAQRHVKELRLSHLGAAGAPSCESWSDQVPEVL